VWILSALVYLLKCEYCSLCTASLRTALWGPQAQVLPRELQAGQEKGPGKGKKRSSSHSCLLFLQMWVPAEASFSWTTYCSLNLSLLVF
jgi:hypothetical protein